MPFTNDQVKQLHEQAVTYRLLFEADWQDCYDFCMPSRHGFDTMVPGKPLTTRVSDDTAQQASDDFASMMVDGVCPPYAPFYELLPGNRVPKDERAEFTKQLQELTAYGHEMLPQTNFATAAQEMMLDLVPGTGGLIIRENELSDMEFEAVPLTQLYLLFGGTGKLRVAIRKHSLCVPDMVELWPNGTVPPDMARDHAMDYKKKFDVFEAWLRIPDLRNEKWDAVVYTFAGPQTTGGLSIIERDELEGIGSMPLITPRLRTNPGEGYGRGPGLSTLPSVRILMEVLDMMLENADIQGSGIWTADDDGTVNFDNVVIDAGMVWPRMPGTRGLEQVALPGKFDLSQFILSDYRRGIRRAFFVDDVEAGRPGAKTPVSAEQVRDQRARLAARIGAPFVRLVKEFTIPFAQRQMFILRKRGRIEIPLIDGREVRADTQAPMALARDEEQAQRVGSFGPMLAQLLGPAAAMSEVHPERMAQYLSAKLRIPVQVLRTEMEKIEMAKQAAAAAAASQQAGVDPMQAAGAAQAFMPGGSA